MEGRHWTRPETLRNPVFWFLVPAIIGPSAWLTALFFQQVHLAEMKGWAHTQIVSLFPIYTLTAIAASLFAGWALDRVGTTRLMPLSQLPMALGFVVVSGTDGLVGAGLGFALVGFSQGTYATLFSAFWAEIYGTRQLGAIKSLAAAFMVLGSAIGPGVTGAMIDQGVPFPDQMPVIAVYFLVSSTLIFLGVRRIKSTPATA